jgi:hypothetical protein
MASGLPSAVSRATPFLIFSTGETNFSHKQAVTYSMVAHKARSVVAESLESLILFG